MAAATGRGKGIHEPVSVLGVLLLEPPAAVGSGAVDVVVGLNATAAFAWKRKRRAQSGGM